MRVVWLAWYICGVCLLIALLTSAITYHPNAQYLGVVLPVVFSGLGLVAGIAALELVRLPPTHPIHQSKSLGAAIVVVAVTITMLLVMFG